MNTNFSDLHFTMPNDTSVLETSAAINIRCFAILLFLYSSFQFLCLFHCFSSASGMFKIVRPAVGESVRYQILPGLVKAYIESIVLTNPFSLSREMPLAELKNKYRKLLSLEKAHSGWEDEYEVSSKQVQKGVE